MIGLAPFLVFWQQPIVAATLADKAALITAQRVGTYFRVNASINGKPVRLIVDSGAGLNVLNEEAATRLGLEGGTPISASGVGGKAQPARIVNLKEFKLGDVTVANDAAVVVPLPDELNCDGLVGYSFLRHFATTFDYDANTLTVRPSGKYLPNPDDVEGELKIRSNHPTVKGKIAGIDGWFVLDTGNNSTGTIYKWAVDRYDLRKTLKAGLVKITGKGVGGSVMGRDSMVPPFLINGILAPKGFINLDESGTGAFADKGLIANIGAEYLRRFTVTLDYGQGKAWFRPSKAFNELFEIDRSGLRANLVSKKEVVNQVVPGSPADEAGIKIGDEIVEVNGISLSESEPLIFTKPLRGAPGSVVKLKLENSGKQREVTIVLRNLLDF